MATPSSSTSTRSRPLCPAIRCNCSSRRTRPPPKRPEVTEPRSRGEERLQRLAEPEKDVATGTRTLVLGPYIRRQRSRPGGRSEDADNPRTEAARLDEAVGLARAIDLDVVGSMQVSLNTLRP